MRPFWRGFARGVVLAWHVAGIPATVALLVMGHDATAVAVFCGFLFAAGSVEDPQ